MRARSGQLMKGEAVGRRDIAYLLGVASDRIDPKPWDMAGPVHATRDRRSSLEDAFIEYYEGEARTLRYAVMRRALDLLPEVAPGKPGYDAILLKGYTTEVGLREVLERLGRDREVALAHDEVLPGKRTPGPVPD